jgi:hypothetical protein
MWKSSEWETKINQSPPDSKSHRYSSRGGVRLYEYAARTEHVPVRWTLTATAMEALTHVERFRSTHQFVRGATGLAAMCGIAFSEADAKDAYHERSSDAHGATVGPTSPPLLVLMEELVRVEGWPEARPVDRAR